MLAPRILYSADAAVLLATDTASQTSYHAADAALVVNSKDGAQTQPGSHTKNALETSANTPGTRVVVVDSGINDRTALLDDLYEQQANDAGLYLVVLPDEGSTLSSVTDALSEAQAEAGQAFDSVHILSHGNDSGFQLADTFIDGEALRSHAGLIAQWGQLLNADGDLMLYGCDLASSDAGRALVADLAALTGADVAASEDLTGAEALGGDWRLEHQRGTIESKAVALTSWQGSLSLTPSSGETLVNNTGGGDHTPEVPSSGQVATNGINTVAVWENGDDIRFRIYGADDSGGQVLVANTGDGKRDQPTVAMNAAGDFVIVWSSDNGNGTVDIYAQVFAADGTPIASPSQPGGETWANAFEFRVNNSSAGTQSDPAVAMRNDGSFLVTWTSDNTVHGTWDQIMMRRFGASGAAVLATDTAVDFSGSTDLQRHSRVIVDHAGNRFGIAYLEQTSGLDTINFREVLANGTLGMHNVIVNPADGGFVREVDIAMRSDGNVALALIYDVGGDRYVQAGSADLFGTATNIVLVQANSTPDNSESFVAIDVGDDDAAVVVWEDRDSDSDQTIYGRHYDANWVPSTGGSVRMPQTVIDGPQETPSVAIAGTDVQVVWSGRGDQPGHADANGFFIRSFDISVPGFVVDTSAGTSTNEDGPGSTLAVGVSLANAPTANVTVTFNTNNTTEATASPGTLTFTPSNWSLAQTVTLTGVRDGVQDGDQPYTLSLSATSGDNGYDGLVDAEDFTSIDTDQTISTVSDSDSSVNSVGEGAPVGTVVGVTALATDINTTDTVQYFIDDVNSPFTVGITDGVVRVGTAGALDHETSPSETVTVRAVSSDSSENSQTFTIAITDQNDPPSGGASRVFVQAGASVVIQMSDITYADQDGPNQPAGIEIDSLPASGTLQRGGAALTVGATVTAAEINAGDLTYTAPAGASGTDFDSFGFFVVDDGGAQSVSASTVTVDTNAAPTITNQGGAGLVNVDVNENTTAVETILSTDPDGPGATYSTAGGADESFFTIDAVTGELEFINPPDFETPISGVGGDNIYDVRVRVEDGAGGRDDQFLRVFVRDVDEAPSGVVSSISGQSGTQTTIQLDDIAFSDPEGEATASSIEITALPANGSLSLNGSAVSVGTIVTAADLSNGLLIYTSPTTASGTPYDSFQFNVRDSANNTSATPGTLNIDINQQPIVTSHGGTVLQTIDHDENKTAFTSVTATDPDSASISYSIVGGSDAGAFSIDSSTGELTFLSPPDFENPADSNLDNMYTVTVRASDGEGGQSEQSVRASIQDVDEPPTSGDSRISATEGEAEIIQLSDFAFADPDGTLLPGGIRFDTVPGNGAILLNGTPITAGTTIMDASFTSNAVSYLSSVPASGVGFDQLEFTVLDAGGLLATASSTLFFDVNGRPVIQTPGTGASVALDVFEQETVVTTVTATDPDGPAVRYRILAASLANGMDADAFTIDPITGAVDFITPQDFEAPADTDGNNRYDFTVEAYDTTGGKDQQRLEVSVRNIDEPFGFSGPTSLTVTEDTEARYADAGPIRLNDPDLAPELVFTATVDSGALVLANTGGASFDVGDGVNDTTMILRGSITELSTALAQIRFAPAQNDVAGATLTLRIADAANLSRAAEVTVAINMIPVNDAPTLTGSFEASLPNGETTTISSSILSVADVDDLAAALTYTLDVDPEFGELRLNGVALLQGDEFTQADIDAGLITYLPASGDTVTETLALTITDSGGASISGVELKLSVVGIETGGGIPTSYGPGPETASGTEESTSGTESETPSGESANESIESGGQWFGPPTGAASGGADSAGAGNDASVNVSNGTEASGAPQGGAFELSSARKSLAPIDAGTRHQFEYGGFRISDNDAFESIGNDRASRIAQIDRVWLETPITESLAQTFEAAREQVHEDLVLDQQVVASSVAVSTGVSIGYVIWLLRGGALLSSIIASMPAWRSIDPLPVLQNLNGSATNHADEESIESMLDAANQEADEDIEPKQPNEIT